MISAPTAPVRIAPTHQEPKLTPSFPSDQLPTKLPIIPTMILPTSPKLLPLKIVLPSHPAMAPITIVLMISIYFDLSYLNLNKTFQKNESKKLKSHKREELVLFIILGVMYSKYKKIINS